MKSAKMVLAVLVAFMFVFAVAVYAQEAAKEKAAEKTDVKEQKGAGEAAKAEAQPAAPAEQKEAAAVKAEEKAAEKTDREEKVEAREEKIEKKDIVDTLAGGGFQELTKALEAAGLIETLKGKGPFTLLAPDDIAFGKLPEGKLDALLKDKAKLAALLKGHVIAGEVPYDQLRNMKEVKTMGGTLKLEVKEGALMIGEAKVIAGERKCTNGLIIMVNKVLE